jgi:hypothetical protein
MENEDFKDKIFERIIRDYGRIVLKQIQLPQNSHLLNDIIKESSDKNDDIEKVVKKLMRVIVKTNF